MTSTRSADWLPSSRAHRRDRAPLAAVRRRRRVRARHQRLDLDRHLAGDLRRRAARPLARCGAVLPLVILMLGLGGAARSSCSALFPAAMLVPIACHAGDGVVARLRADPLRARRARRDRVPVRRLVLHDVPRAAGADARSARCRRRRARGPERWQRRERVYWMLFAHVARVPGRAPIAWVNFDRDIAGHLEGMYPGRVALMTTVLDVGAIVLWLAIYHYRVPRRAAAASHRRSRSRHHARAGAQRGRKRQAARALLPGRRARARVHGDCRAPAHVRILALLRPRRRHRPARHPAGLQALLLRGAGGPR